MDAQRRVRNLMDRRQAVDPWMGPKWKSLLVNASKFYTLSNRSGVRRHHLHPYFPDLLVERGDGRAL